MSTTAAVSVKHSMDADRHTTQDTGDEHNTVKSHCAVRVYFEVNTKFMVLLTVAEWPANALTPFQTKVTGSTMKGSTYGFSPGACTCKQ